MKIPKQRKIKKYFNLENVKFVKDEKEWRDGTAGYVTLTMREETLRDIVGQILTLKHINRDWDNLKNYLYWDELHRIEDEITKKRMDFLRENTKD